MFDRKLLAFTEKGYFNETKKAKKTYSNYCAAVLQGIAALFLSTKNNQKQNNFTFSTILFTLKQTFSTVHSGRSPPFQTGFSNKNQSERNTKNVFYKKNKNSF